MAAYAVVRDSDGQVLNVVEWDGVTQWSPPVGTTAVVAPTDEEAELGAVRAVIGGSYSGGMFHSAG